MRLLQMSISKYLYILHSILVLFIVYVGCVVLLDIYTEKSPARCVERLVPPVASVVTMGHGYEASMHESFGFMRYFEPMWERKKKLHQIQSKKQHGGHGDGQGRKYFQFNWEPNWSCGYEQRIGNVGDGGKWVCDAYMIADAPVCNIISIGSNNEWSFEISMHELNPRCIIHTFDHTITPNSRKPAYVVYYPYGLGASDDKNIRTMDSILRLTGLTKTTVDVLKIDCEGCEFQVYKEITKGFIRQILIEIHMRGGVKSTAIDTLFEHMGLNGYVIFHKEPNTYGCSGDCIEYSFVKLNLPSSN